MTFRFVDRYLKVDNVRVPHSILLTALMLTILCCVVMGVLWQVKNKRTSSISLIVSAVMDKLFFSPAVSNSKREDSMVCYSVSIIGSEQLPCQYTKEQQDDFKMLSIRWWSLSVLGKPPLVFMSSYSRLGHFTTGSLHRQHRTFPPINVLMLSEKVVPLYANQSCALKGFCPHSETYYSF